LEIFLEVGFRSIIEHLQTKIAIPEELWSLKHFKPNKKDATRTAVQHFIFFSSEINFSLYKNVFQGEKFLFFSQLAIVRYSCAKLVGYCNFITKFKTSRKNTINHVIKNLEKFDYRIKVF